MTSVRSVFVGIGSAHGDDQIGWRVADELRARVDHEVLIRQAAAPAQLLDWLEGCERLAICDACEATAPVGTLFRWKWPDLPLNALRFHSSHDLALPSVLELAAQLGKLPSQVWIWGVTIDHAQPGTDISRELAKTVPGIVDKITAAMCDA